MKKIFAVLCAASLALTLLAGCSNAASASGSGSDSSSAVSSDSQADAPETDASEPASTETADMAKLEAIVAAIEAVNEVPNPMALEEFQLENDLLLTMDNLLGYKGDVTNNQADCALVLAVQAKEGKVDAVKSELEAYKETASSNLYAEFADKVAKAQDARIVVDGNFVVMVIAGLEGPDYSVIDTAIEEALA